MKRERTGAKRQLSRGTQKLVAVASVRVTVAATWFFSDQGEAESSFAERQKLRIVKANLVSIIEEHVRQSRALDAESLQRIIDVTVRGEGITDTISAVDLVAQAEYNILNDRSLTLGQKEECCRALAEIYRQLADSTMTR